VGSTSGTMILGGQSLVSSPPVFSHDGKKLLVCTGFTVSIFSTSTGMKITELEGGHTDRVTSVVVVPVAAPSSKFISYCWTSSLDGTICYWDFSVPELIKKVKVQLPIHSMVTIVIPNISCTPIGSSEKTSNHYAFISVEDLTISADENKAFRGQIQIYNLTKSRRVGGLLAEVTCADNHIHLLKMPTMEITKSIAGIKVCQMVWIHNSYIKSNDQLHQRTGWRCQSVGSYK
ncbi:hypothetical protein BHE74_00004997, partial [Ensete ventricosum]